MSWLNCYENIFSHGSRFLDGKFNKVIFNKVSNILSVSCFSENIFTILIEVEFIFTVIIYSFVQNKDIVVS